MCPAPLGTDCGFHDLVLFRPSPGPRKRQSTQYNDPKPQSNRPGTVVRAHRPSAQNLHNDKGKAVRSRDKKEQNKGREEKVNGVAFKSESWSWGNGSLVKVLLFLSLIPSTSNRELTTSPTSNSGNPTPPLVSAHIQHT